MYLKHENELMSNLQALVLCAASWMLTQPASIYDLSRLVSLFFIMFSINFDEVTIGGRWRKPEIVFFIRKKVIYKDCKLHNPQ